MNASATQASTRHLIMHFTHVRNLSGILATGCLQADSFVDRSSALRVEAADLDIKAKRKAIRIRLAPYGCVTDYVPFYFAPRSPMLYKLAKGGVPTYTDGQDPLIYLVSTVDTATRAGLQCLFSDGNCTAAVTQVCADLTQLDSMVDWEVMHAQRWNNTAEDGDRMRRRMAEFLVHERLPIGCVAGIAVRTDAMKEQVDGILATQGASLPVRVRAGWYF
jgi:ssDNA thymidine ADP-ribosyltransferase, DarT